MTELEERIRRIYEETDDWGEETNRRVELEIGLSLTPTERLRWLETMQENFARWTGQLPSEEDVADGSAD